MGSSSSIQQFESFKRPINKFYKSSLHLLYNTTCYNGDNLLPGQVWGRVAPRCIPPEHSRSHHQTGSVSGWCLSWPGRAGCSPASPPLTSSNSPTQFFWKYQQSVPQSLPLSSNVRRKLSSDQMFPLKFEIRPDGGIDYSVLKIKCTLGSRNRNDFTIMSSGEGGW